MSRMHRWTKAQSEVAQQLRAGMIIRKDGRGFALFDANGRYVGKASVAVKTLAKLWMVASTGEDRGRIHLTTIGWRYYYGGTPTGEAARLCALADARVEYVKSMIADDRWTA